MIKPRGVKQWGVPKDAVLILLPARLTRWKGQTVAIEALARLDPKYHLVLLGDAQGRDDYVSELKEQANSVGRGKPPLSARP